ncbi:MAG: nucleotidyl transferase AbiEii/AbiGii toxin family protein [Bdellovibrionales bacterium]|nr:nucleotidyl transferase AbiEii/AbiGii toxin family protein [Bdellovibrionales bacterium]
MENEIRIDNQVKIALVKSVKILNKLKCDYVLVGALVRDILFSLGGVEAKALTKDIDLAFAIESWELFQEIKNTFLNNEDFHKAKEPHRVLYKTPKMKFSIPVDLLPFGGVTDKKENISWPPDQDIIMSVIGYKEAFKYAESVKLEKNFSVKMASVDALIVLKLFAWRDRNDKTNKDAIDIDEIFKYIDNIDSNIINELFDEHQDLTSENFDFKVALVGVIGRRIFKILEKNTIEQLKKLLTFELEKKYESKLVVSISNEQTLETRYNQLNAILTALDG